MAGSGEIILAMSEARRLVVSCMEACGAEREDSELLAELLVVADYRGHYSHGLNRLDVYPTEVKKGVCLGGGKTPSVVKETVATALVDGNNLLGPVVGKFCTDLAIKKAKEAGIGIVTARGSNHYGIAGWYSMRAAEQGLIGLSCTNTSPCVVPTRAKNTSIGTNPISFAAPGNDGDMLVLDMATSTVAWGKLEVKARHGEPLPHSWAIGEDGKETLDPNDVKGLLPLGGIEESGGYKGYGLGLMVEALTSVLSGSMLGPFVRQWKSYQSSADLGQCFMAVDPSVFEDGFLDRMSAMMKHYRNLEPAEGEPPVVVPGDPEKKHMSICDDLGGIPYHPNQIEFMNKLAANLNVPPPQPLEEPE